MSRKRLTPKQQAFCEHYIACLNATEAAMLAGYSKRSAKQQGAENLSKPDLREYIDAKLEEMSSKRIADATEVMEYLTRVMRREEDEHSVIVTKTRRSYLDTATGKRITEEEEVAEAFAYPTRVLDANKAAELVGKRYGLFTDKVEMDINDIKIEIDYGDEQDTSQ